MEVFIYFAGVIVAVFTSLEPGIYVTVGTTAALLLFRTAKSSGRFLGRVDVFSAPRHGFAKNVVGRADAHEAYITADNADGSNPEVPIRSPHPGVFVYRFTDGFNYLNSARHLDILTISIFNKTRKTKLDQFERKGVRIQNKLARDIGIMLTQYETGPALERASIRIK